MSGRTQRGPKRPIPEGEWCKMIQAIRDGNPTGLRDILTAIGGVKARYNALSTPTRAWQYPLHIDCCNRSASGTKENSRVAVVQTILDFIPEKKRFKYMLLQDLSGHTALHTAAIRGEREVVVRLLAMLSMSQQIQLVKMADTKCKSVLEDNISDDIRSVIQSHLDVALTKVSSETKDATKQGGGRESQRIPRSQTLNPPNLKPGFFINGENAMEHIDSLVDSVAYSQNYNNVIELKNKKGQTILHRAAIGGRTDIVKKLLSALNSPDEHWKLIREICNGGKTALHYASSAGCLDIVLSLLRYSLNKDIVLANYMDKSDKEAYRYSKTIEIYHTLTMVETHHWKTFYQRPIVLVFYNRFTEYSIRWQRNGAEEEKDLIVESFQDLGMASEVHVDFSMRTIFERINNAIEAKKGDISALIIVVMSHGEEGLVYDRNLKKLTVQLIIDNLCNNIILQHTPKVLLVQSCRGRGDDSSISNCTHGTRDALVVPSNLGPTAHEPRGGTLQRCRYSIPCEDMMVVMSTLHGQTSYRARLAAMLRRITGDPQCPSDILDMFVRINGAMGCDQTMDVNHTFKRKLLLKNPLDDSPSVLTRIKFMLN